MKINATTTATPSRTEYRTENKEVYVPGRYEIKPVSVPVTVPGAEQTTVSITATPKEVAQIRKVLENSDIPAAREAGLALKSQTGNTGKFYSDLAVEELKSNKTGKTFRAVYFK
jgi:hypothetical protein